MNTEELNAANIENLTGLWRAMGATPPENAAPNNLCVSPSWPNRCWLDWDATSSEIETLAKNLEVLPQRGIVPVWPWPGGGAELLEQALSDGGYALRTALNAMAVGLETIRDVGALDIQTRRVETPDEVALWTEVGSQGFGYTIDEAVIHHLNTHPDVALYLTYADDAPAATALTFQTGDVMGLHQLAVPKAFRGQGVGRRAMEHIMALCHDSGCRYATLQASAAGEGMYRKMGFEPQFEIRSYQRVAG